MSTIKSHEPQKIKKLLNKLKAMSERGEKHESLVAAIKIKELNKKYGLDINHSIDVQRVFKLKDWADHKNLLLQCIIDTKPKAAMQGDKIKKVILADLTDIEYIEVCAKWKYYWKELSRQKKALFAAFVLKNKIGTNGNDQNCDNAPNIDLKTTASFMEAIDKKQYINKKQKQIQR